MKVLKIVRTTVASQPVLHEARWLPPLPECDTVIEAEETGWPAESSPATNKSGISHGTCRWPFSPSSGRTIWKERRDPIPVSVRITRRAYVRGGLAHRSDGAAYGYVLKSALRYER